MVIAEVSIIPLGTKTSSVSRHVARAVGVLRKEKDVKYELTSMGTIIEGELEKVLRVVMKMHQAAFDEDIMRVITTIKIDDRRDKPLTMDGKMGSLMRELEH